MADITLKVGGKDYVSWEEVKVKRSIETMAGSFILRVSERWTDSAEPRQIYKGQSCQLLLAGQPVITGYIDDAKPYFDTDSHSIEVSGRCKTGDLVDCSAIYKSGQWSNRKIEHIAADLCAPFNIKVVTETDTGAPLRSHNIQQGETVFECIERAARMRGLLLISNPNGDLVITRASTQKISTRLVQGENVLSAAGHFSMKDRYSQYIFKGQSKGSDEWSGEKAAHGMSVVFDRSVPRYRPLLIVAHDQGSGTSLHDRAVWEKNVRMGRGDRATIPVQGWTHADGLWLPNIMVDVQVPHIDLDNEMLIASVEYTLDEQGGTKCEHEITRREAFELVAGAGRTKLSKNLREKWQRERRKKGDTISPLWDHDSGAD